MPFSGTDNAHRPERVSWSQFKRGVAAMGARPTPSDAALCAVFRAGGDVHRRLAALVFDDAVRDASEVDAAAIARVTPEQRKLAKNLVYAVHYGQGAHAFAEVAGVDRRRAAQLIQQASGGEREAGRRGGQRRVRAVRARHVQG